MTLFLLSADLLFVNVGGVKIKYGYLLLLGLWLFDPGKMLAVAKEALVRVPKYPWLLLVPAGIAIVTSTNPGRSVLWLLWLFFDLFVIVTVYAFLKVERFSIDRIQTAAGHSLGLMAFFGIVQFIFIFGFDRPIFNPQFHLDIYRLNGLSGWPHFFNIYAFLLLPIVLTQRRLSAITGVILVLLIFVLAQSTAKTGWVLFVALGILLLAFNRTVLLKKILLFAIPVAVVALALPIPSFQKGGETLSGAEKLIRFGSNFADTSSVRDRMLINEMGVKVWLKHPWFGVGPKAYDTYVFSRFDQELPGANKLDVENNLNAKNENIWIEFLAEAGIFFALGFAALVVRALWVRRFRFANPAHLGAWIGLVLYFAISGQVSQTGLLTLVYAVFGIYFYAAESPPESMDRS